MKPIKSEFLKPLSVSLRKHFDEVMSDRHNPNRFLWDWWHLPGRYTHLRTPAELFFPENLYSQLESSLKDFGRKVLGCGEISPIWLSNYVEGCEQRLHADRPHGPWAFVLALTTDPRNFSGGETVMLKPAILDFWKNPAPTGMDFEEDNIVEKIPSKFGRLLVFDPRIPHGVSRVSGTLDPLKGRLVLHGWFTPPNPFIEGALKPKQIEKVLQEFDQDFETFNQPMTTGTVAYRISILAGGKVKRVRRLGCTMLDSTPLDRQIKRFFLGAKFPKAGGASELTLPLTIEL